MTYVSISISSALRTLTSDRFGMSSSAVIAGRLGLAPAALGFTCWATFGWVLCCFTVASAAVRVMFSLPLCLNKCIEFGVVDLLLPSLLRSASTMDGKVCLRPLTSWACWGVCCRGSCCACWEACRCCRFGCRTKGRCGCIGKSSFLCCRDSTLISLPAARGRCAIVDHGMTASRSSARVLPPPDSLARNTPDAQRPNYRSPEP
mmetsp:Transcript_96318/g.272349  ORF Transcript_96318/g.272349 Transcript_96318/m.272349 type:complete len:204 (+) Transcript_96318:946-1557(+)